MECSAMIDRTSTRKLIRYTIIWLVLQSNLDSAPRREIKPGQFGYNGSQHKSGERGGLRRRSKSNRENSTVGIG